MPQISSNFIFKSKQPNFERDSFKTWDEMINVPSNWIDEGHISYCSDPEYQGHYVFTTSNSKAGGDRWVKLSAFIADQEDELKVVNSFSELTDDLANSIPFGGLVYSADVDKYYYNIHNDNSDVQSAEYIECEGEINKDVYKNTGIGWFKPLVNLNNYLSTTDLESRLENYVTTTDLESRLENYVTTTAVENNITVEQLESKLESYATNEQLAGYVTHEQLGLESNDLTLADYINSIYLQKSDLDSKLEEYVTSEQLDSKLDSYVTKEDIGNNVTNDQLNSKLEDYVTKEDIENNVTSDQLDSKLDGYVTKEDIGNNVTSEQLDSKLDGYVTNDQLDSKLDGYVTKEDIENNVTNDQLNSKLEDYVTTDSIDDKLSDYATKEDLQNIEGADLTEITNKVDSLESQVTTISAATGSIQQSLNNYKEEVADKYTSSEDLEKNYVKGDTFQQNVAFTATKISNIEDEIESIKTGVSDIEKDYVLEADFTEVTDAIKLDLDTFKEEVENTYIKPEEVASKLNNYAPSVEHENRWIGSEFAGDLAGKTGLEVANAAYSYSAVLDQMLFHKYTPTVSQPEVNIELKENWSGEGKINWYDEKNRIILVKAGSIGPDGGDFIPTNAKDAIISYPKGIDLANNFTNGLIPSTDEQQTSIGFCRIKDEDGNWVYYRKENNIYHVPSTFEVGEYRYYMAAYFKKGSPAVNNDGMTVAEWNENDAVESKDYITIIASKPALYNTTDGFVENDLALWGDDTTDYMELAPSCQLDQAFKTPRKLKGLYIWNDVAGDYAKVPMVFEKDDEGLPTDNLVPLYFAESIDENNYYTYIYDSSSNGHRGAIKIKVVF